MQTTTRKMPFATARNGKTKEWQHKEKSVRQVIKYLGAADQIELSQKEFNALGSAERAKIKNGNPAFFGGYFEGRRTSTTVRTRSIVALDIDKKFNGDFFRYMKEYCQYPFYIYESISSTPKLRKWRVLFFLSEDIDADYYEPVARKIAGNLSIIDYVDQTCYRKTQMMYAPVYCSDVIDPVNEFIGELDQPFISTAEIMLDLGNDPLNPRTWDKAREEGALRSQNNMTLNDPREKSGLIGQFCRFVGDIHGAITMYSLPYVGSGGDRYSYTNGTSANGFVVYDGGQWAYSNHESDPAAEGGHDLNAFDLVRIHLFGDRDREKGYKEPTKAPSYKAMAEMLTGTADFQEFIAEENAEKVIETFGSEFFDDVEDETSEAPARSTNGKRMVLNGRKVATNPAEDKRLKNKLKRFESALVKSSENGQPISNKTNAFTAVNKHPYTAKRIAFDTFTRQFVYRGLKPWNLKDGINATWIEEDETELAVLFEHSHGLKLGYETLARTIKAAARKNTYNSLADFLENQLPKWDGKQRIDTLFYDAFRAKKSDINALIARKTLLGGLERALNENETYIKGVPVLQGGQSIGKSTFWRLLALDPEWFTDSKIDIGNKDGMSVLSGSFIVELSEFASVKRADRDEVKQFLSSAADKYRPPYGRDVLTFVRHNIFVGSVNDEEFLTDATGNTRFKTVSCPGHPDGAQGVIDLLTQDYVLQIWAEAMQLRQQGESAYYNADEEELTEDQNAAHVAAGTNEDLLEAFVTSPKPLVWNDEDTTPYKRVAILRNLVAGTIAKDNLECDPATSFSFDEMCDALNIPDSKRQSQRTSLGKAVKAIPGVKYNKKKRRYTYRA